MPGAGKFEIQGQRRLFDEFFKIDEIIVSHARRDGTMGPPQRRLIFERADAAAVLLLNTDTDSVVLLNQFKAPTLGKGLENGWITEAFAGMVMPRETPEDAAVREVFERTGYRIRDLKPVASFFSSPGGSSEIVHLYYATVTNGDMVAKSAGADLADGGDEDIEIRNLPVEKLFEMVDTRQVEDPKLLIGALWLKGELQKQLSDPLPYSTAEYSLAQHPDLRVGYKTGHISGVKGVDIWVNSENEDMVMDRYIGRTISASIRFLGARKDEEGNLIEDIINDELTTVVGSSAPVKIGTVFTTGSGHLQASHGVNAILHVATVRGVEHGYKVEPELVDLATCVGNVMQAADKMNRSFWRRLRREKVSESILFPIIGAGIQLGLHPDQVIPGLLDAAIRYLQDNPTTTIKRIYFLAFTGEQRAAIIRALGKYCDDGTIRAM